MDLDALLAELLRQLESDGVSVAIFPTPAGLGVVVSPTLLAEALREELTKYGE